MTILVYSNIKLAILSGKGMRRFQNKASKMSALLPSRPIKLPYATTVHVKIARSSFIREEVIFRRQKNEYRLLLEESSKTGSQLEHVLAEFDARPRTPARRSNSAAAVIKRRRSRPPPLLLLGTCSVHTIGTVVDVARTARRTRPAGVFISHRGSGVSK